MRNGYRIYDADTHIAPTAETLERYLSARVRQLEPNLDSFKAEQRMHFSSKDREPPYPHMFRLSKRRGGGWGADVPRTLGEAEPRDTGRRAYGTFQGTKFPDVTGDDWPPQSRLHDMDEEGVDVHLMVNSGIGGHENPEVNAEFMRAVHRYLDDYCSADRHRLKSMIAVDATLIEESAAEIRRWGGSAWATGVYVNLPIDYPLDHPDLHPLWEAADEHGLCIIHHSFSMGYPGYRDLWNNPFIGRTASHPWGAMRAMASFFGAGLLDRFPNIRFAILESGFGWLPFWTVRMEDQAHYMGFVAEGLEHTMTEYATSGRFFVSIVLHEGGKMVKLVSDFFNDDLLMFSTDYPHPESRFPTSVDLVMGWPELDDSLRRKVFWDNAVKAFGEP